MDEDDPTDEQPVRNERVRRLLRVSSETEQPGAVTPHTTVHDDAPVDIDEGPHFTDSGEAIE